MPIYEYKCNKCGVFEAMQGIKESPLKKCPTCKSKVERQMSRGSFILKGSGWYATDYAKKSTPTDSDSVSTPAAPATNGSASSDSSSKPASESKPATESKSSSTESKPASKSKSSSEKSVPAKASD